MPDFEVRGADQLARAARALKAQGTSGNGIRKELLRGIRASTKPLIIDVKQSAVTDLPHEGGLNKTVAFDSRFATRTRTSGSQVGVRIVATSKVVRDLEAMDRGELRHPVRATGPRKSWVWVEQRIRPGWFSRPLRDGAPTVRKELLRAMERVVHDVTRRSHR